MTSNKQKIKIIAESFRKALKFPQVTSKTGAELLFDNDLFAALFRERFGIISENKDTFNAAFQNITEGTGKEIKKINSVTSSALLPLLVFYKLCIPKDGNSLILTLNKEKIVFTKAYFEVRNNVVRSPSCVDVALVSHDGDTILFLESKLVEMFEDTTVKKVYGSSYKPLYEKEGIKRALNSQDITVDIRASDLILRSEKTPQYLEGIKQTISHLIGLVKGPQNAKDQSDYISAYKDAKRLIYSPILFDTKTVLNESSNEYSNFVTLYSKVIGDHKDEILADIQEWVNIKCKKSIEILPTVLTYQKLIKENPNWLDPNVEAYYGL